MQIFGNAIISVSCGSSSASRLVRSSETTLDWRKEGRRIEVFLLPRSPARPTLPCRNLKNDDGRGRRCGEGKREEVARSLPFVLDRAPSDQPKNIFPPSSFDSVRSGEFPILFHVYCTRVHHPSVRPSVPSLPLESRGGPGGGGGGGQEERRGQDEVVGL